MGGRHPGSFHCSLAGDRADQYRIDGLDIADRLLASFAALVGQPLPTDAGPDSQNILPALLGQSSVGRTEFVGQNNGSTPMRSTWLGWWPLTEGAGTVALDRSLNGHPGVLGGSPAWSTEEGVTVLHLDGTDDDVEIAGLPSTVGDLTLACWARSDQTTWNADGCLISRRPQFALHPVQGTLVLQALSFDLAVLDEFQVTRWHHYAVTYESATGHAALFVDGLLRSEAALTTGPLGSTSERLTLGSDGGAPGTHFDGELADVRIYDQVFTPQRIRYTASARLLDADADTMLDEWEFQHGLDPFDPADASLDSDGDGITNKMEFADNTSPAVPNGAGVGGLIGYWSLDGSDSTTAIDSSGNGNHGVLMNRPRRVSSNGRSYVHVVAARQQFIEVAGLSNLNSWVTVACWARSDTSTWNVAGCLVSRRPQWLLHPWLNPAQNKRVSFMAFDGSGMERTADINLSTLPGFDLREWHHYAGTYDPVVGELQLYVDGILVDTAVLAPGLLQDHSGPVAFGKDYSAGRYFGGGLDEVYLYDRVLDPDEILALTVGFDDDQDGLPDDIERRIIRFDPMDSLHTLAQVLPDDDFDGDGASNAEEATAGTDSTSPDDRFRIVDFDRGGTATPRRVVVEGRLGRTYSLERGGVPGEAWSTVHQIGPLTNDAQVELVEPAPQHRDAVHYRSVVE